jgi:hypothetical protein
MNGHIHAVALDDSGNLYAGGNFTTVGGVGANYIAKWNGSSWSAVGNGVDSTVNALALDGNGNVYAGGDFPQVCGNSTCDSGNTRANRIAKWNGSGWSVLGNGVNSTVYALAVDSNNNVYAGGDFAQACGNSTCDSGNTTVNRIAKWNGTGWSTLGSGTNGTVNALVARGGGIFAGGNFTTAGGKPSANIGVWLPHLFFYLPLITR